MEVRITAIICIPYLSYLIAKVNNIMKMLNNIDRPFELTVF